MPPPVELAMTRRFAICLVAVAMILTWPLHIGAAAFMVTEWVGNLYAPNGDHVLLWFPVAGAGVAFTVLLIAGIYHYHRPALIASSIAFLGALWTLARLPHRTRLECNVSVVLALLLVGCAIYLWWISEHIKPVSRSGK